MFGSVAAVPSLMGNLSTDMTLVRMKTSVRQTTDSKSLGQLGIFKILKPNPRDQKKHQELNPDIFQTHAHLRI